jgi:hypothetical protein
MKNTLKANLTKKVTVRFKEAEYKKINAGFRTTTQQKLSGYIRNVLLQKPVTVYTRNQSFDAFVAEMILLRRELSSIGNNFNQAVRKLHTMEHLSEIKTWALLNENSKQSLFKKIEEINLKIEKIAGQWSQE